jgi:regulator of protease activity HflC (stomatin/prohibitin superfamily)
MQRKPKLTLRAFGIVVLLIIGLTVIFSSYTIISPGHRGVVVMLGRVEDAVLAEGFHLVIPPVLRRVVPIDVRTKKLELEVEAASSDLQIIQVTGTLNYHLEPLAVGRLYQEVGADFESIIIVPALHEAIKAATAKLRVEDILVQRATLKKSIQDNLTERLAPNHILVEQFSVSNVSFSAEFDAAIERKQVAEQAALQKQYELQAAQKDVEITLAKAEGEKKAAIIAAEGRAEARRVEAEAEATALGLIADQLRKNPDLIRYEWAVRLSPSVSTVLLPADESIILDSSVIK